jgi:hypothetical protein
LHGHATTHQLLPRLDQAALLAHFLGRQVHGGELAEPVDIGQAKSVVAIGLAFEVLELPGLAGGVGDQTPHPLLGAEVMDPAG